MMEKYVIADRSNTHELFRIQVTQLGTPVFFKEEDALKQFQRSVERCGVENVVLLKIVETSVSVEVRFNAKGESK